MSLDGGRSAASIGVTDRGKCVLKRERVKVDEGLGKSEEIGPLLAIRSDEGFSMRRVTDEKGKVERLHHRFERTAQGAFDYEA
jgi:hypothetical protein